MIHSLYIEKFRLFKDVKFEIGKRITVIAGHNAVGKSTLLGILGNMVEYKQENIFGKQYRTEFSEIFKGSPGFDKTGEHKGMVNFCLPDSFDTISDHATFRSTWQSNGKRFRIIPDREQRDSEQNIIYDDKGKPKRTAAKYTLPVMYLGLSRLYPLGETSNTLENDSLELTEEEKTWFAENYKTILSIPDDIIDISNMKTKEVKSNFTGISTNKYDALCNSAGQDNLGQILLSLLSFRRLHSQVENWEGGLLIIDELDATLHPIAQQKLIKFLFHEAKQDDLQIIFTSHSLSILEYIADKYDNNVRFSQDYKLIFISNANIDLKIYHNPPFELIRNNLALTLSQDDKNKSKILVYSEDDDTRWFFKKLIFGYSGKLKFVNANFGCGDLAKLLKEDSAYFSTVLFVVDGDVKKNNPKFVSQNNVIALIGTQRPEKVLFDYLNNANCEFWDVDGLEQKGMTKKYFLIDNGPHSEKYSRDATERHRYSHWFHDQKKTIEQFRMFNYWKNANNKQVEDFRNEFIDTFNKLARKNSLPIIEQKVVK
ncbi:MAG: AAA family ATPase [Kiritimatiellae bacterium]|jgi:AAA15 family ATPase/GTPase|nr:AAA family ATPase [Kiritimatiellia bacterium]